MMGGLILALAAALSLVMAGAWAVALNTGRSGWIDAIWSFGVGGGGVIAALAPPGGGLRPALVAAFTALWSLRLGTHIAVRTLRGGDDPRYARLREDWGAAFRRRLFWFLQLQAAAAFVLVMSLLIAARHPAPGLRAIDGLGLLVMLAALVGEMLADRQLMGFRADPANRGRVCDVGLWAWSRHPNYFFEWLVWAAVALVAVDTAAAWSWLAFTAPALMYGLLAHVSGVPPLEAHLLRSRGDAFRAYQARVNAFWPGPPRRKSAEPGRSS